MLRLLKLVLLVALVGSWTPRTEAFSLLGPYDTWQAQNIGYQLAGDIGGPMNLGEEYRWNVPLITYAFDSTFLEYYGSNGVRSVDAAFNMLNTATTNIMRFSSNLTEFPLNTKRENYRASALSMLDIKSTVLTIMLEQLGLASPSRFTWTIRGNTPINPGGYSNIVVIKRNFDPISLQPSSYVDGVLYTYAIREYRVPDYIDSVEIPVDPLAAGQPAIADAYVTSGQYYTGLTRDDAGGLRYLLNPRNYNQEALPANTEIAVTNLTNPQFITTISLSQLIRDTEATTNTPAVVLGLYPNLDLIQTNLIFTNIIVTNNYYYYTNKPYTPIGYPPALATNIIYQTNAAIMYSYKYRNVVTNHVYTNGVITWMTNSSGAVPWTPLNGLVTLVSNSIVRTSVSNYVNGDVYIVPPANYGYVFAYTNVPALIAITNNVISAATNVAVTNVTTTTNSIIAPLSFTVDLVTYFTNQTFIAYPVEWQGSNAATVALRPGRGGITFMKVSFESEIGTNFVTITNISTDSYISTNTMITNIMRRRITGPDFLFTAADIGLNPNGIPWTWARNITGTWINNSGASGQAAAAGPGVITPPVVITFNKLGDYLVNQNPGFLNERTGFRSLIWGSFDGTTNAPKVYPENGGQTMNWLEQLILQRQ